MPSSIPTGARGAVECQWTGKTSCFVRAGQLARPKTRQDGLIREPTWRVSSASRRTVASARVQELAKPKQTVEGYLPSRQTEWPISKSTLRAIASERTQSLSKPIIRETMDHVQFNPDAFTVSETARKANASQRIVELAQPISRGHKWWTCSKNRGNHRPAPLQPITWSNSENHRLTVDTFSWTKFRFKLFILRFQIDRIFLFKYWKTFHSVELLVWCDCFISYTPIHSHLTDETNF